MHFYNFYIYSDICYIYFLDSEYMLNKQYNADSTTNERAMHSHTFMSSSVLYRMGVQQLQIRFNRLEVQI